MRPARAARLAAGLLALASSARAAGAQVIAGQVVSAADGAALENAVVALLDSARRQVVGVLSSPAGAFALRAPAAGRYWVRAARLGNAPSVEGPFDVGAGETVRVRVALSAARRLTAVRVTARERCAVRPEAGALATQLWDAVRVALEGTSLALDARAFPYSLERFERTLDPGNRRLVHELRWINPGVRELFASAPAPELQRLGWVRGEDASSPSARGDEGESPGLVFHGPDARVLVSDAFVDAHCLRAVDAPAARAGQVGLAFEPAGRRRPALPDVRGTLWLDTATSELRDLEFEYTDLPRLIGRHRPGGAIAFARLPNGLWYVSRWSLRMPVLVRADASLPPTLESVREVGGRTLLEEDMARVPPTLALVRGIVIDSTAELRPVAGAVVRAVGTPFNAMTDSAGRFRLELPDSGAVTLAVQHPRLAALGVRAAAVAPRVLGRETVLPIGFPSAMTVRRQLCGARVHPDSAVVVGAVWARSTDPAISGETETPQRGLSVSIAWRASEGASVTRMIRQGARTDTAGHFHACGLPAGVQLSAHPIEQTLDSPWTITVPRGGLGVLEWVVVRGRGGAVVRPRGEPATRVRVWRP